MSVTIKDIAEHTGLAVSTISKYINGGNVLPENQDKIQKAIGDLKFQVNPFARSMKTNKSYVVGVVNSTPQNTRGAALIDSLKKRFRECGYFCVVENCAHTEEEQKKTVNFLLSKNIDALIFIDMLVRLETFPMYQVRPIPVLTVGGMPKNEKCDQVDIDDYSAVISAVRLMLAETKDILYLGGNPLSKRSKSRMNGFQKALESAGVPYEEKRVSQGENSPESAYQRMQLLLKNNPGAKAVFVAEANLLAGALFAMTQNQLRVPEDIHITTFENESIPESILEMLNVLTLPLDKISATAFKMLMNKIDNNEDIYQRMMFPYELIMSCE